MNLLIQLIQGSGIEIIKTANAFHVPQVRVTATDDGVPPRTSTATLTLILSDVNDCEPRLKQDYNPVVPEHQGAMKVQDIEAVDDDEIINGPPFLFWIDPQAPESIKRAFRLEVNPSK